MLLKSRQKRFDDEDSIYYVWQAGDMGSLLTKFVDNFWREPKNERSNSGYQLRSSVRGFG